MKTKSFYVSLPISWYDLDERKSEAERIKSKLNFCGLSIIKVITPFDVCPEPDKPTPTIWARTSRLYWSAMLSICAKGGKTQKGAWQSLRWQEFTAKK